MIDEQQFKANVINPRDSVLNTIEKIKPDWTYPQCRSHLNDFLFKKNQEINKLTSCLSGGEKARLSLAQIAAKPPRLLILDEITNNLDLNTREHVLQCLQRYPGPMIIISHDQDFLDQLEINQWYDLEAS